MIQAAAIGIDLGGTFMKGGLVAVDGSIQLRREIETQAAGGFQHTFERLVGLVEQLAAESGSPRDLAAVGIGVPGPMSHARGFIYGAPNLPGWVNIPLRDLLTARLSLRVIVENDANAAAYGEFVAGAGRDCRDMVMLTLGTGIGGGVIVDGRLIRGHFDNAGEIGHMIVALDGRPCPCGQRGCLERYASANAVGERAAEAIRAGRQSALSPTVTSGGTLTSVDVARAAREGDALACEIWDDCCRYLALACANLQHLLNPERVVLAGGLINAGEQLLGSVRRHFGKLTWAVAPDQPRIELATLGGDAGTIGAGTLALVP